MGRRASVGRIPPDSAHEIGALVGESSADRRVVHDADLGSTVRVITKLNWHVVRLFRLADALHRRRHDRSAALVATVSRLMTGADIEPGARIGEGLVVQHGHGIVIGRGSTVGRDVTIYHQVTLGVARREMQNVGSAYPTVEDGVVLYAGAKIVGAVTVGAGAVVGANAVVVSDVPAGCTAVGNPAEIRWPSNGRGQPRHGNEASAVDGP